MNKKIILLGAHISISGGFHKAIEKGEEIGCTAIQIFTKSGRSWFAKEITQQEIDKFQETLKKSSIKSVIAHSAYLINLGSPKKEIEQKSIKGLKLELERCDQLSIPFLVIHPGAHLKSGEEKCLEQIAKNLSDILKKHKGKTKILLETTAGQGTNVGYKFEHLQKILNLSKEKNKMGVCLDTCHIFSAGYDIGTTKGYEKVMSEFSKTIGLKNLKVIHLNDSKTNLNSRKDRHENLGKGTIPISSFRLIMNDKRFEKIPKILETPVTTGNEYYEEIKLLKKMVK